MNQNLKFAKLLFITLTLVLTLSCDGDDDNDNIIEGEPNSVVDYIENNPDYSLFFEALILTELNTTLSGSGTFTVFAPDNDAFTTYLNGEPLENFDTDVLTQLLLNHVLNQTFDVIQLADLPNGYVKTEAVEISSNANISMYVDVSSTTSINGQSTIITPDIEVDNGVIHLVDSIIELPTLFTFISSNPELSTLISALTDDGNTVFTDALTEINESLTIFAPNNAAFTTFLEGAELSDINNAELSQILSYHLITDTVGISTTLTNGYMNTAATYMENKPLSIYMNTDDAIFLNGSTEVIIPDIVATNGVLHIVDTVIAIPDIVTFITVDPNLSTLLAAFTRETSFDYISTLQTDNGTSPAPFTVFAPTNDAFIEFISDLDGINELEDIPTATLASTLELHILTEMNIRSEDFADLDGMQFSTLNGANITVDGTTPAIIGPDAMSSGFVSTTIQTSNGVIHTIDRVLRE